MARTIAGKRILLTGASSGIGRSLAGELAEAGASLMLTSRSVEALAHLRHELSYTGAKIQTCAGDLTDPAFRSDLVRNTVGGLGGLDVLINNAGVAAAGHFSTSTEAILRRVMEVNFFAPIELIRECIPHLTEGDGAAIVNVSSMCGRRGIPAWPEYSASKYALCGLTESLRGEMARFQIDTLLIVPGLTQSGLRKNMLRDDAVQRYKDDEGMQPRQVAKAIVGAIRKNRMETVLGGDAKWMLRLHRYAPRLLERLIVRRMHKLHSPG